MDPSSRWEKLCRYGMFHGGDSDSTGIIAGACYGAMFGLQGVPLNNYLHLEYRDRLEKCGESLYYRSLLPFRKDTKCSFSLSRRERSLDSFREFPNRNPAGKKRVTFKDETTDITTDRSPFSNSRKEVHHDLFSLDSNTMDNNRNKTRVSNIPDAKSISQRRSRSHSPPSRMPETHLYSDSFEKAVHLRMVNIDNYSHFSTTTTKASNLPYKYYAHSKYIPKKSDVNITQSPKSFSPPITDNYRKDSYKKQSRADRTIYYPPNYTDKLQYKPYNSVAYSYGGYEY